MTQNRFLETSLILALGFMAAASDAFASSPLSARGAIDRRVESPAGQAGLDNTTSTLEMKDAITWPANAANSVSFDYTVESQESGDFLQVYRVNPVNNLATLLWQQSGLKSGHQSLVLPVAGGAMKIRFRYTKNGSNSRYLDAASVDNVRLQSSAGGVLKAWDFNDLAGGTPAGWVTSGFAGVWSVGAPAPQRSAGRPAAQAGQPNTVSAMERSVIFPTAAGNFFSFDYYVDSASSDALRVYFDPAVHPAPVFSASGRNQIGRARITAVANIPLPAGPHVLRFEYAKGSGPAQGQDIARIRDLAVYSGQALVELHTFRGRNLGTVPIRVGSNAAEWSGSGVAGGWTVYPQQPHKSYAPAQAVGQKLLPHWTDFTEPVVDGRVTLSEYPNATEMRLRQLGGSGGPAGEMRMVTAGGSSGNLYVALHVQGATSVVGNESGTVTLYLDAGHPGTLAGTSGCGSYGQSPGAEDRKVTVTYNLGAGSVGQIAVQKQQKGSCGAWVDLAASDPVWPVAAAVNEPLKDAGWLSFELQVHPPASVFADGKLGLAVRRDNTWGGIPRLERLPYQDVAGGIADDNVYTWETVELTYLQATQVLSDRRFDGCCFPGPDLPGSRW